MATANRKLLEMIPTLTPEEQAAVEVFIQYLKERETRASISPQAAFEDFVREHSELLHRLAQ